MQDDDNPQNNTLHLKTFSFRPEALDDLKHDRRVNKTTLVGVVANDLMESGRWQAVTQKKTKTSSRETTTVVK